MKNLSWDGKSGVTLVLLVLMAAVLGLGGCQAVGNDYRQDGVETVDKSASNARAGMIDKDGNWNATGPQMASSISVDGKGVARTNAGASDSVMFWNGQSLGIAENANLRIKDSKFFTPMVGKDGETKNVLVADIGEIVRNSAEATRASNEALDRVKDIVATITPAQMQVALKQAEEGNETARLFLQLAAAVASGGATTVAGGAVGAVGK